MAEVTACEVVGVLAVKGACPFHGGDYCLRQMTESEARMVTRAWQDAQTSRVRNARHGDTDERPLRPDSPQGDGR